jgi:hypothetical protein
VILPLVVQERLEPELAVGLDAADERAGRPVVKHVSSDGYVSIVRPRLLGDSRYSAGGSC